MTDSGKKITPFVEWLEEYKKGETDGELTHELRTLIEAVQETGKPGVLTLTLKVSRKGERQVNIIEDVKVKTPVHSRSETIYFVDQHLNLTRNDPRQGVLTPIKKDHAAGGEGQ
jgi:hypothetical protein